jgi:hypothetical protein
MTGHNSSYGYCETSHAHLPPGIWTKGELYWAPTAPNMSSGCGQSWHRSTDALSASQRIQKSPPGGEPS